MQSCGRRPHFLEQKASDFEIYGVSARTRREGGLSQCGHFVDKGRGGQFFAILCGVFYGRPLSRISGGGSQGRKPLGVYYKDTLHLSLDES